MRLSAPYSALGNGWSWMGGIGESCRTPPPPPSTAQSFSTGVSLVEPWSQVTISRCLWVVGLGSDQTMTRGCWGQGVLSLELQMHSQVMVTTCKKSIFCHCALKGLDMEVSAIAPSCPTPPCSCWLCSRSCILGLLWE